MESIKFASHLLQSTSRNEYAQQVEQSLGMASTEVDTNSFIRFFSELSHLFMSLFFSSTKDDIVHAYQQLKQDIITKLKQLSPPRDEYEYDFSVTVDGVERTFMVTQKKDGDQFEIHAGFRDQKMEKIESDFETFLNRLSESVFADSKNHYLHQLDELKLSKTHQAELTNIFGGMELVEKDPIPALQLIEDISLKEFEEEVNSVRLYKYSTESKVIAERSAFTRSIACNPSVKINEELNQGIVGCDGSEVFVPNSPVCILQKTTLDPGKVMTSGASSTISQSVSFEKARPHVFSIPQTPGQPHPYQTCGEFICQAADDCKAEWVILLPPNDFFGSGKNAQGGREEIPESEYEKPAEELAKTICDLRKKGMGVSFSDHPYGGGDEEKNMKLAGNENVCFAHQKFWHKVNDYLEKLGEKSLEPVVSGRTASNSKLGSFEIGNTDMIVNVSNPKALVGNSLGLGLSWGSNGNDDLGCRSTLHFVHAERCKRYHQAITSQARPN